MRKRAPPAENGANRGKPGAFVAVSSRHPSRVRVKALETRVPRVVVDRSSTYFCHVSDLNLSLRGSKKVLWAGGLLSLQLIPSGRRTCRQGTKAVGAVGKVWSRDIISQAGGVEQTDDTQQFDSNPPAGLSGDWGADVDSSARLLHELEILSDASPAASPPAKPPVHPPSASADPPGDGLPDTRPSSAEPPGSNPPSATNSAMRSARMSSVSEQDHLNPRDPLYYAPRSMRERST